MQDRTGDTPVHEATRIGDLDGLQALVLADPAAVDRTNAAGCTPLMVAAYWNQARAHTVSPTLLFEALMPPVGFVGQTCALRM